jgi:uncharacterized Zn-binding protein involved in type VI secretion
MGQPAARISDMHVCPMVTPGVPPVPHLGGLITGPGAPTVLIAGMPAAVMGDMATCVGPPDSIMKGSVGVMICGKPAARMGDMCAHGGTIVLGCPTVLIGEVMPGAPPIIVPPFALPAQSETKSSEQKTSSPPPAKSEQKPPKKEEQKKKEWIEVVVKDENGKPIIGEKYEIELPDGLIKRGVTDMNGKVKLQGLDPGQCKITFPDRADSEKR